MRAERAASHWSTAPVTTPRGRYRDPAALADGLLERPLLRGAPPRLRGGLDLVVVDDDVGGAWPASPSNYLARALRGRRCAASSELGERVVLAFAEPRARRGGRDSAMSTAGAWPSWPPMPHSWCCSAIRGCWPKFRDRRPFSWPGTASA